ncbi:hypothetical protein BaRGS_00007246, partial [Batillaria attramentaria]
TNGLNVYNTPLTLQEAGKSLWLVSQQYRVCGAAREQLKVMLVRHRRNLASYAT